MAFGSAQARARDRRRQPGSRRSRQPERGNDMSGVDNDLLLEASGICKRFGGVQALSEVGFSIRRGEIYGLIGPNGAGKTSLFNVLTGIYKPESGALNFLGGSLLGLKSNEVAERGIARTFQNIRL